MQADLEQQLTAVKKQLAAARALAERRRLALEPFATCVRLPGEENYEGHEAVPPNERQLNLRGIVFGDIRSGMILLVKDLRAARDAYDAKEDESQTINHNGQ